VDHRAAVVLCEAEMKSGMKITLDDKRLLAMPLALQREADELCGTTAKQIEGRAKVKIMDGPKTGKVYQIGKVTHQASAPGEAPATDTGNLVNSINTERVKPMLHRVNVHAEYAASLEYGTSRMSPRPFLQPSFEDERSSFKTGVDKLIKLAKGRVR
jgi:hypothetical protein